MSELAQERVQILVETLKTLGEPVKFSDLRDLTKDKIVWSVNPDAQLNYLMKQPGAEAIARVGKGLYAYRDPNDDTPLEDFPEYGTVSEERTKIIRDTLKYHGAMSLKDLVEKTKDQINWTNQYSVMHYALKKDPGIVKVGRGFYKYELQTPAKQEKQTEIDRHNENLLADFRSVSPGTYQKRLNKELKRPYRIGEIIYGRVTAIEGYGVFLEVIDVNDEDRNGFSALVHLSRVKRDRYLMFNDLFKYFKVGDIVQAKINSIRDGKVALDTFDTDLPEYSNDSLSGAVTSSYNDKPANPIMAEKLGPLAQKFSAATSETATQPQKPVPPVPATAPVNPPVQKQVTVPQQGDEDVTEQDFREVETYLNGVVGLVSPEAKDRFKNLIQKYGWFKFTRMMMKAESDFKVDAGLMFARVIEEKAGEYL